MRQNPLKDGALTMNSVGLGTVTRKMVWERAVEFAAINGRTAGEVTTLDWEQARMEMTGEPEPDAADLAINAIPATEGWDPIHGSAGSKAPVCSSEDEDGEGRSDRERLVTEGIAAAEDDHERAA